MPPSFVLTNDCDHASLEHAGRVFEHLNRIDVKVTTAVFSRVVDSPSELGQHCRPGETASLAERAFARLMQEQQRRGHEIAYHGYCQEGETREQFRDGLRQFRDLFGAYPYTYVEHGPNPLYAAGAQHKPNLLSAHGDDPRSPYYIADLLREHCELVWTRQDLLGAHHPTAPSAPVLVDPRAFFVRKDDGFVHAQRYRLYQLQHEPFLRQLVEAGGSFVGFTHFGYVYDGAWGRWGSDRWDDLDGLNAAFWQQVLDTGLVFRTLRDFHRLEAGGGLLPVAASVAHEARQGDDLAALLGQLTTDCESVVANGELAAALAAGPGRPECVRLTGSDELPEAGVDAAVYLSDGPLLRDTAQVEAALARVERCLIFEAGAVVPGPYRSWCTPWGSFVHWRRKQPIVPRRREDRAPVVLPRGAQDKHRQGYLQDLQRKERVLLQRYVRSGTRVLDVGCGAGRNTFTLLDCLGVRPAAVTLIDVNEEQLDRVRRNAALDGRTAHLLAVGPGSVFDLPGADAAFDVVLCLGDVLSLASGASVERGLRELARVLAPGGVLIFSLATREFLQRFAEEQGPPGKAEEVRASGVYTAWNRQPGEGEMKSWGGRADYAGNLAGVGLEPVEVEDVYTFYADTAARHLLVCRRVAAPGGVATARRNAPAVSR